MQIFLTLTLNLTYFLFGYLMGSLNTSILFGKLTKKPDLRLYHSKNAGATNSLRVYGTKSAVIILLIDILKTFIVVLICKLISKVINDYITDEFLYRTNNVSLLTQKLYLIPLLGGIGVLLGNIFPVFYKFKGGKGVAGSVGLLISINITLLPIAAIFFFGLMFWKRYVSLASVITSIAMIGFISIPWINSGFLSWVSGVEYNSYTITISLYIFNASMINFAHRENIKRLLKHQERKFGQK